MNRVRGANGRFVAQGDYYIDAKGYPRYGKRGPLRGKYVHRVMWERYHKKKLETADDVHHIDGNKLNFAKSNLKKLGHAEHGYVSAKQHWYVTKIIEAREKAEWEEMHGEDSTSTPPPIG